MKKVRIIYSVIIVLSFLIGLPAGVYAGNIEAQLLSNDGSDAFQVQNSGGTPLLHVNSTGNVGIGTIIPDEKLSVNGRIESISGGFKFPDGSIQMTATLGSGIPSGGIIMWSGSIALIPAGWALCDGNNGTPDLRDRFIVGAGTSYSPGNNGGATAHSHGAGSYMTPSHNHGGSTGGVSFGGPGSKTAHWLDMEHTHPIPTQAAATISGTSASASSLPPYYALAYIMKL